jgi:hypothetical protein
VLIVDDGFPEHLELATDEALQRSPLQAGAEHVQLAATAAL